MGGWGGEVGRGKVKRSTPPSKGTPWARKSCPLPLCGDRHSETQRERLGFTVITGTRDESSPGFCLVPKPFTPSVPTTVLPPRQRRTTGHPEREQPRKAESNMHMSRHLRLSPSRAQTSLEGLACARPCVRVLRDMVA